MKKYFYLKTIFLLIFVAIYFLSCRKVNHKHPDMVGDWTHFTQINAGWVIDEIIINSNGRGHYYPENSYSPDFPQKEEVWLIKNNELHFKRTSPVIFAINSFPTVADQILFSGLDTIHPGETYMKLNEKLFKKKQ